MDFNDLSAEQKAKVSNCRTIEELFELAKEEGMDISDEELDGVAGGAWCNAHEYSCPGFCQGFINPNCKK